jgi:hypothetical protein
MIQFGGHHLGLNVTMIGERGVLAPVLTGAQPAVHSADGRPCGRFGTKNDAAFDLLHSFDEGQRKTAIIEHGVGFSQDPAMTARRSGWKA